MNAQDLLQEIADYCRHSGLAESTFGRRAVNDGKLTARLRNGGRITTETLDRIRGFMETNRTAVARPAVIERAREPRPAVAPPAPAPAGERDPQRNFRFFDNRQKYLLFVNTCSEKWVIASRVALGDGLGGAQEPAHSEPSAPMSVNHKTSHFTGGKVNGTCPNDEKADIV